MILSVESRTNLGLNHESGTRSYMIVLNVTYKCKPDMRSVFLSAITREGIDAASRAEAGNLKYEYYLSVAEPDELLLVEWWKDAQAVTEHGKQEHYAALGRLKADYVESTSIARYETQEQSI